MDVNVRLSNIKDRHKLKQLNSAFIAVLHFTVTVLFWLAGFFSRYKLVLKDCMIIRSDWDTLLLYVKHTTDDSFTYIYKTIMV
jgi:hypothetical protein